MAVTSSDDEPWRLLRIGDVAVVNPPKPRYDGLRDDSPVGFVPMASVDERSGIVASVEGRPLKDVRSKSYRTFSPGDVLFAKITPCMENGKCAVAPSLPSDQGFGSTEFHVLRPTEEVEARYLWRYLRQPSFRAEAEHHMTGSVGQLRVPPEFLRNFELPVPRIDVQRRITEVLDQVEAHRDVATGHLSRAREMIATFRQAVLAAAIAGRLTEDWRDTADVTDVQAWLDVLPAAGNWKKSSRARESRRDHFDERSESIPPSWLPVRLGDVLDVATGATPLRRNKAYYEDGTVPWVTSGAVNAGLIREPTELITELALAETNVKIFPAGTLLVAMYGEGQTRGRVAELGIDAATNQAVAALLVAECPDHLRQYLRIFFEDNYRRLRRLAFGGVQPNLSLGVIKDMVLPMPPPEEQAEIVRRVDTVLDGASQTHAQIKQAARLLDHTGQAALAQAFRGELISEVRT
jgi:type I restriction enzyme S subunit